VLRVAILKKVTNNNFIASRFSSDSNESTQHAQRRHLRDKPKRVNDQVSKNILDKEDAI